MAQDPAGRAMLVGGATLLAAWLAIAAATAWLFLRRPDHPVGTACLWLGGAVTLLGGVVVAVLVVQAVGPFGGRGEREWQAYLEGLKADERAREAKAAAEPDATTTKR